MFDIGWGELLLIGIVALIAIGPKELPGALRTLGQWMGKLRRMASEFQGQFHEAMREAELADLKKQVDEMTTQAQSYANFDPVGEVRKEFETTQQQIESAISGRRRRTRRRPTASSPAVAAAAADSAERGGAPRRSAGGRKAPKRLARRRTARRRPAPAAPDAVRHDAEGKPA